MTDVERICRQCPEDRRYERCVLLMQEAPDGTTWYLCIRCWVDWDRDERGSRTVGVFEPAPERPPVMSNGTAVPVSGPPVASTTIPLPGGASPGTTARRAPRKPASAASKRST